MCRILVVEDHEDWQEILPDKLNQALKNLGFQNGSIIAVKQTFIEANQILKEEQWDLLVTDFGLGPKSRQMLGRFLVETARDRNIPAIVVSGSEQICNQRDIDDLKELYGAAAFFTKLPFDSNGFIKKVQELLSISSEPEISIFAGDKSNHSTLLTDKTNITVQEELSKQRALSLFYSYSRKDEDLRNELEAHLKGLEREGLIEPWHDRCISAGEEWEHKIDENLDKADIILLLISSDFINSKYCFDKEMAQALKRHEEGKVRVIPIIVRDVHWRIAPFKKLNPLPTDGRAVKSWPDRDEAWCNVSQGIEKTIQQIQQSKTTLGHSIA